jgi:hypothetical protein
MAKDKDGKKIPKSKDVVQALVANSEEDAKAVDGAKFMLSEEDWDRLAEDVASRVNSVPRPVPPKARLDLAKLQSSSKPKYEWDPEVLALLQFDVAELKPLSKKEKSEFYKDLPKTDVQFKPAKWLDESSLSKIVDPFTKKVVTDLSVELQTQIFQLIRGAAGVLNELSFLQARFDQVADSEESTTEEATELFEEVRVQLQAISKLGLKNVNMSKFLLLDVVDKFQRDVVSKAVLGRPFSELEKRKSTATDSYSDALTEELEVQYKRTKLMNKAGGGRGASQPFRASGRGRGSFGRGFKRQPFVKRFGNNQKRFGNSNYSNNYDNQPPSFSRGRGGGYSLGGTGSDGGSGFSGNFRGRGRGRGS